MRRRLLLAFVLASSATACNEEDPAPVYVEVDYQVRCIGCMPRAQDDLIRNIAALDAENGFSVRCSVVDRGGRAVTFSAAYTDPEDESANYSFGLTQVLLEDGPGAGCRVQVREGSNRYEGICTDDEPDADAPCQVELSVDGDVVTGSVFCVHIPNAVNSSVTRHIVAPGTEDEPASFEVHGCPL